MEDVIRETYWAQKGEVRLRVYRKHAGAEAEGPEPRRILVLVHGSSFGAESAFDLEVPGHDDYSFMDRLARLGYDVWTVDHEGYGHSDRTESNSDIASGAADLLTLAELIREQTGQARFSWYGQSSGALRLALFAQDHGSWIDRIILDAFVWTGEGSPTLEKRRENLDHYRAHHTRSVDRAFFHSIFTRDKPGTSDPAVADALADIELAIGDTVPTGTYLDMCANLPVVDPTRIDCPVMITRGEHDGVATEDDLLAFFSRLPCADKQFVVMDGMAHVAPLSLNRRRFWHICEAWFATPPRVDVGEA